MHWTHKYLDITIQSFFIQNLIKVSHNHFFSLEVAEIQAWRSEFNGSTWALSMTWNFFFSSFPKQSDNFFYTFTFLSSTYFSDLKFCVFLSLLLSLSSSVFLSSQANYLPASQSLIFGLPLRSSLVLKQIITNLKVRLSFTASSFTHSPSFYSRLTLSSLKNISGQPKTTLHEEIFWGGNWKTRVRFRKLCSFTVVQEVHRKI